MTRITVKHVLYEGARSNNILRINDDCFEKLVDILNLELDDEQDDEDITNIVSSKNLEILHSRKDFEKHESSKLPDIHAFREIYDSEEEKSLKGKKHSGRGTNSL